MVTASTTWFWNQGHSKTQFSKEIVRVGHIRPDSNEPIERYDLETGQPGHHPGEPVPVLVNPWTGEKETPPRRMPMIPAAANNPAGERVYKFEKDGHVQFIWFSHRFGMINRWRTVVAGLTDVEWMAENMETAMGLSMGGAEFWIEHFVTASINIHGPTFGGARNQPFTNNPVPADALRTPPSVVIHSRVTDEYLEGASLPLDFRDDPNLLPGLPYSPMGADATHSALYWRRRFYERTTPIYKGDPFVSLCHRFFYSPTAMDNSQFSGSLAAVGTQSLALSIMQQLSPDFDQGYYADLDKHTELQNLEGLIVGPTFDIDTIQAWAFDVNLARFSGPAVYPSVPHETPGPWSLVLAHTRSSDGFTVAAAVRLDQLREVGGSTWHPSEFTLQNGDVSAVAFVTGVPFPSHEHPTAKLISIGQSSSFPQTRVPGWTGFHFLMFAGPKDKCMASLRAARGVLNTPPDPMEFLPSSVREGTELADQKVAVEPPPVAVKLGRSLRGTSRLR